EIVVPAEPDAAWLWETLLRKLGSVPGESGPAAPVRKATGQLDRAGVRRSASARRMVSQEQDENEAPELRVARLFELAGYEVTQAVGASPGVVDWFATLR